jgi:hypothetical protein
MQTIKMHTRPTAEAQERSKHPAGQTSAENLKKIQDDFAQQMAQSASRIGEAMSRSLEIAETGMTLGLKLLTTGGERLIHALAAKIASTAQPAPATGAPEPEGGPPGQWPQQPVVGNSIPIAPGGAVYISFSLSNDVQGRPKRVAIALEPLQGERSGHVLDMHSFSINPVEREILPLDFEKFIVRGTIEADTPSDRYIGSIAVTGDEQFTFGIVVTVGEAEAV